MDSIIDLAKALRSGKLAIADLHAQTSQRIADQQAQINAVITPVALAKQAFDPSLGMLSGIPFAHKDVFCTDGIRSTCGSKMLDNFIAPYEAHVGTRLKLAGAALVAKSNMDEFAMGSSNEHSFYGAVRNPWDLSRVPGGSSGGSAALVAAGVVPFATGSDTGGSVRQPAAFCGITGIKATYGRVSRYGMVAFASSLDQAGVFTRTAEDAAHVLAAIAGHDPRDATCAERGVDDYVGALGAGVSGLRIGVVKQYFGEGVDTDLAQTTRAALAVLEKAGAKLVDISMPSLAHAVPAYYVIAPAEASSNLARYDGVRFGHRASEPKNLEDLYCRTRAEGFGEEVQRRILVGTFVLSAGYFDAYYIRAQKVRRLIANEFTAAFAQCDVLAGPTTPTVAYPLGQGKADPAAVYRADITTVAVNLAGLPAISVPAGFSQNLPVGLQLIGPAFSEARLLCTAHALQQHSDFHRAKPAGLSYDALL